MKSALPKLIDAAAEFGFDVEPPRGKRSIDMHTTLVRGPARIAISNIGLYYHDHRVWLGDPAESHPARVTVWKIIVDPESRRQGKATEAVRALQRLCESSGLWLQLEATPIADQRAKGQRSITSRRLISWYKTMGFSPSYPAEGFGILEWRPPHGGCDAKGLECLRKRRSHAS